LNRLITSQEALELLWKAGCSPQVIQHCQMVSNLAVKLARKQRQGKIKVNIPLVRIGGLLHDIGRSKTHTITHAIVGVDIAQSENLPPSIIQIIERHIGSGISIDEAEKLNLPKKSYIPETLEEKLVSYADKLIEGNLEIRFDEALHRYILKFGESSVMVKRLQQLHSELQQGSEELLSKC